MSEIKFVGGKMSEQIRTQEQVRLDELERRVAELESHHLSMPHPHHVEVRKDAPAVEARKYYIHPCGCQDYDEHCRIHHKLEPQAVEAFSPDTGKEVDPDPNCHVHGVDGACCCCKEVKQEPKAGESALDEAYKRGREIAIENAANCASQCWNDSQTMTNQKEQAYKTADAIRALK
jgi:hypothetical protein